MINQKVGHVTPGVKFQPSEAEAERKRKTDATMASSLFVDACEKAGVNPTRRQAIKFKNGQGAAYKCVR